MWGIDVCENPGVDGTVFDARRFAPVEFYG